MTNTEIVDKYLTSIGMKRVSGTSLEPILPFFMLDAAYNMWLKDVQPIECKHEAKKMKKEWVTKYGLFNRSFFRQRPGRRRRPGERHHCSHYRIAGFCSENHPSFPLTL